MKTRTPEALWREIEAEAGTLGQIDVDGLRHALELALIEAMLRGENVVAVPRAIAERMLTDLQAQRRGQPRRSRNSRVKDWWLKRWELTAADQLRARRIQLQAEGLSYYDALFQAAEELSELYPMKSGKPRKPSTLIDWATRPGRRRK